MTYIDTQNQLRTMQNSTDKLEYERSKDRYGEATMDKHAFLRLLTEQLKNQDPLKPMDNMEFVQQQAAFSQIEELQNLSKALTSANSLTQSSTLIGKLVTVANPDNTEETITGTVTAAHIGSDGAAVEIDGNLFPLDYITRVESGQ